ncbi:ABC transporter substrate-binding protein [Nocardioides maradonensis]
MNNSPQRRLIRRSAVAVAAAAVAAGSLSACGSGGTGSSAGLSSFTIGSPLSGTIDPIHSDQEQTDNPDQLFYDPLVSYDSNSKLVPRLASSWTVAPDAKSITLTLRTDVKFHDGTALTAKDVVFTLDRLHTLNVGIASLLPNFASAEAKGDGQVVIKLTKPDTTALGALSRVYILNSALVAKHEGSDNAQAWLSSNEAGSGPYTLASFTANSAVKGQRFATYWDFQAGRPATYNLSYIQESTAAKNALLSGGLDLSQDMSPSDVASFKGNSDFTSTPMPTTYAVYAFMNTQSPALKDVRVRQAISLAFDYQGAFQQVFGGQGQIGNGPLPQYLACRADLPTSAQNVDQAKQLIQQAGASGLKLKIFYQPTLSQLTDLATLLASNLKAIGIDAQLQTTTYPQYLDMLKSPSTTPDISMVYEGAPYPDPGTTLFQTYDSQFVGRGSNFGQYANPKVDRLVQTAIGTADETKRCDLYKQAQVLIAKDYVSLNIALGEASVVARTGVTGVVPSPIHVYFDEMAIRTGS